MGILLPPIGEGFEDETTGSGQAAHADEKDGSEVEPVN